ncbi:hypothetical protein MBAV_004942 [Candidatus Magnetobacterium bavaricum]|uniref:Uncharacterized protein n=1 Tax=Candidatus Magnetobacterium bavaricum TaxID=29290 RepID=A0A0F3GLV2_9BACT|nr:hypothetical protein MBAV_004942 [Candidatus Magnetobacterium bavaricum]
MESGNSQDQRKERKSRTTGKAGVRKDLTGGGSSLAAPSGGKKDKGAQKVLESMACDPIAGMAAIANDPDVDVTLRAKLLMELAQYVYPKRKVDQTESGVFVGGKESVVADQTYEQRLRRIRAMIDEPGSDK